MNAHQYHVKERRIDDKPLGRNVNHDPASAQYGAAQALKIRSVKHQAHGLPLTQTRGSCTAEALCGALDSDPDYDGTIYDQAKADQLYDAEIVLEGGDPATDDPGGSGLLVCKAAKRLGWLRRYEHAFGLEHALKALTLRPVIIGSYWYEGFDDPDPATGLVTVSGFIRGAHEYVALDLDLELEQVGLANSWGLKYGIGGMFRMTFKTLEELLRQDGDVTVPLPLRANA